MNISEFEESMGLTLKEAEGILVENDFNDSFLATHDARTIIYAAKQVIDTIKLNNERSLNYKTK